MFDIGRTYKRREIHAKHGGQQQGGISTPKGRPYLLLFSGAGQEYGYRDGWDDDGVFLYSGEGQVGNMDFTGGNKAIRDHARDGKDPHLFEQVSVGQVRYLGCFVCCTWNFRQAKDKAGRSRRAIVFHLVPMELAGESGPSSASAATQLPLDLQPLEELRKKALASASQAEESSPKRAKRSYYERSEHIRTYVLKRAGGVCEVCEKVAPFHRKDGSPYLEPHHTRRLSDGGPDHPRWVGAVCPNCHREIHYGVKGKPLNRRLEERLGAIQPDK
ncbi:MAG: HNH endonuclease [Deltaproteobacteria bacterium]|nr:HNH endonuclease [Deltaproteobacteria bacterium]MCZ6563349.1 HNH endonuclease [Deltaproteobacteria bacterium]